MHNLDVACWAIGAHPIRAVGMGGRQVISEPEYGQSYDHFAVDYEFPNGVHVMSMARQIEGCENNVSETIVGTKGQWHSGGYRFTGANKSRVRVEHEVNPYVQEHIDLLESIVSHKPVNELKQVAESTLTAIMGRMSAYTGKAVTWDNRPELQARHLPQEPGHGQPDARAAGSQAGRHRADLSRVRRRSAGSNSSRFADLPSGRRIAHSASSTTARVPARAARTSSSRSSTAKETLP